MTRYRSARGTSLGSMLALVALAWIALIAPPCVMGLTLEAGPAAAEVAGDHHCPHCPPDAGVEQNREDCGDDGAFAVSRPDKNPEAPVLAPLPRPATVAVAGAAPPVASVPPNPEIVPGLRLHLRHGQFNE